MQTGVLATQIVGLEGLDGLDGSGADQIRLLRDARQILERIDQALAVAPSSGPVLPVMTVPSLSSMAAAGAPPVASLRACACFPLPGPHGQPGLIHQQLQLVALALLGGAGDLLLAQALVVPAHDLLAGASQQTASSTMQLPAMFTPMSVGDL